ncbi:MAG TPA: hypothetical protein DHM44_03830 [Flexistipes sinusarabici]|uniref:NadR/Ttd14 AAA domain-containing protein n=1 Tax=Flexistipes sinusarabici TaxID=2352 RepID=A0A3D5QCA2_FLESI|nr:hypothetical protein [Flexistipes sinusarabici]
MSPPLKIVVTGGPCAGKTTIIPKIEKELKKRGFNALILPEVPTLFSNMGFKLGPENPHISEIQKLMFRTQLYFEDQMSRLCSGDPYTVILLDRGLLDYWTYTPVETWAECLEEAKIGTNDLFSRYDFVLFLDSVAVSSERYYELVKFSNTARFEDAKQAKRNNAKLLQIWSKHPSFSHFSPNESLDKKISKIIGYVEKKMKNKL